MSKNVGADGRSYEVLPDNDVFDITPQVDNVDIYRFGVTPLKHKLVMKANNSDPLEPNKVADGATNCVGQKVVLNADFVPAVQGIRSVDYQWQLPVKFVNAIGNWKRSDQGFHYLTGTTCHPKKEIVAYPGAVVSSPVYFIYDPILKEKSTGAWWYSGGEKTVGLSWDVDFLNGQSAFVAGFGRIQIHRPTAVKVPPKSPNEDVRNFTVVLYDYLSAIYYTNDPTENDSTGSMQYWVRIRSDYSGKAGYTQIATLDYIQPSMRVKDYLDGSEFWKVPEKVYESSSPMIQSAPGANDMIFQDNPWSKWAKALHENRLKGEFEDYIRFRPDGGDNIYVTLGLVSWSMHAEIKEENDWALSVDQHPPPSDVDANVDEFPTWSGNVTTKMDN